MGLGCGHREGMAPKTTRSRIIEAALVEFDEKGYEAATVATICGRAGVSNGSFFHAFASKDAVAGAVFLGALGAYHHALIEAITPETSPSEGVAALVTAHVHWVIKNRRSARFMFLHGHHTDAQITRTEQAADNARFRKDLEQWCEPHLRRGALFALPPDVIISQVIGPAQLFCRAWLSERSNESPDKRLPQLIACAIRAVVKSETGRSALKLEGAGPV